MSDFNFCSAEHHLEVMDRNSTTFRSEHKFEIEAAAPSRFFVRPYRWTGSGVERQKEPEIISEVDAWGKPRHRMHGPLLIEDTARIMVIDLGRSLNVGEVEQVHIRHHMRDLDDVVQPFFSVMPSTEIRDTLLVRVTLPAWPGLICKYRGFTPNPDKVDVDEVVEIDGVTTADGKVTYEKQIVNPSQRKMAHKLEWTHV